MHRVSNVVANLGGDFAVRMMIRQPRRLRCQCAIRAISVGQRAARLSERSPRVRDGNFMGPVKVADARNPISKAECIAPRRHLSHHRQLTIALARAWHARARDWRKKSNRSRGP